MWSVFVCVRACVNFDSRPHADFTTAITSCQPGTCGSVLLVCSECVYFFISIWRLLCRVHPPQQTNLASLLEMAPFSHQRYLSLSFSGKPSLQLASKHVWTTNWLMGEMAGRISLITAGVFGMLGVAAPLPPPPTLLLNATTPLCACLVSLHFSLSVSDLASFLLSLFHSDSPEGKLISTV